MTRSTLVRHAFVSGLLITALAAGDALARGGDSGSGRSSSSHSSRSYSSGGNSGGSHSSSFSSGGSRSSSSWSGGSPSSRSQSFSRSGPSGNNSSARSFFGGGQSSSGSYSSRHGSSFPGFSSSRSLQSLSGPSRSGGPSASSSFGRMLHSDSGGGGQSDQSAVVRRGDSGGSSHSGVQQAGAWQSAGGQGFPHSRGWSQSPSGDEVRSFLHLSGDAQGGNRFEAQYPHGNDNSHGNNRDGNRVVGTRGPDSSQRIIGTRSSDSGADSRHMQPNRSGGNGNYGGPHGGGSPFSAGGSGGHGGHQGGQFDASRHQGSDHGHGGNVAYQGWSRKTHAADFQRMADSVRGKWRNQWRDHDFDHGDHRYHGRPFYGDWWKHYRPSHHGVFYWDLYPGVGPYFWWSWAAAPRITAWFSFGWPRPYYWDYGPGEYIYCYDHVIYVNGLWYMPEREYYQRTYVLAQRVPEVTPDEAAKIQWLPLGVFALTPEGTAQSDLLLQLAVTDDGVLGGTLFNQATGESFPVQGIVENPTQRAVWSYVNPAGQRVVMETGIYNLTKPDTTALVHFGPDDLQIWQMVHLEQPSDSAAAPPAGASTAPPATPQPVLPQPK